jgi:uncharacterized membrane protein
MTVEAVPVLDPSGVPFSQDHAKAMHTTMQTLGRFAIISGFVIVAAINIFMFSGVAQLDPAEVAAVYGRIYLIALVIPVLSVTGVILGEIMVYRRKKALIDEGLDQEDVAAALTGRDAPTEPNVWLLGGGLLFAVFTIAVGAGDVPFAQEIVFLGSMAIVVFLISRLLRELPRDQARALVGTAIIIFVFPRHPPCPVQARHGSKSMSLASTSSSCRCSASSHPAWLWSAWCFCAR